MRKIIAVVHTSLDGFVAGINGELSGFAPGEENLQFVCQLTDGADAALFGRISYEMINGHWPQAKDLPGATKAEVKYSQWYNGAQKIVVSKSLAAEALHNTVVLGINIANELMAIKQKPGKNILLFGSPSVVQLLMRENCIDSYWIFINPVLFGKGIPLFNGTEPPTKLKLAETKQFLNGELALHYIKTG